MTNKSTTTNPSTPPSRHFRVKVTTDLFEPEFPKGSYVILDPARAPIDGDLVLARFHFGMNNRWVYDVELLTAYEDYSGHDVAGRFCKRGDPREACIVAPIRYSREQRARGLVTILGTVSGCIRSVR
jgi:hypothetical protein